MIACFAIFTSCYNLIVFNLLPVYVTFFVQTAVSCHESIAVETVLTRCERGEKVLRYGSDIPNEAMFNMSEERRR